MKKIFPLLLQYDLSGLSSLSNNIADYEEDDTSLYAIIRSQIWLGKINAAKKNFDNYTLPQEISNLLQISLLHERGENSKKYLFNLLREDFNVIRNDFLKAEHLFHIGYHLLQQKNYGLARLYYQDSIEYYSKLSLASYIWRSQFNVLLCNVKSNEAFDKTSIDELIDNFFGLPDKTRFYFARFMSWFVFYIDEWELGYKICKEMYKYSATTIESIVIAQAYYFYAQAKYKPSLFFKSKESNNSTKSKENSVIYTIRNAKTIASLSSPEINRSIEYLYNSSSVIHSFMAIDVILDQLLQNRDFKKIERVYERIKVLGVLESISILPPKNFNEYGLLAYHFLGRTKKFDQLFYQYQERNLKWKVEPFLNSFEALRNELEKKYLTLDLKESSLSGAGTALDLSNSPMLLQLVKSLARSPSGISIEDLYTAIYMEEYTSDNRNKLNNLLKRLQSVLKLDDFILRKNNRISISKDYIIKVFGGHDNRRKQRLNLVLNLMKRNRRKIMSSVEISHQTGIPKRTLSTDLCYLVENGYVEITGSARSTRYKLRETKPTRSNKA